MNDKLHVKICPDLMASEIEVLWIELCPFKSNCSLFIAGSYRPPSSLTQDDASIAKNIEKVCSFNKEMVILGDFNVDLLNANQASKHKLVKTLENLHLTQLVKDVTRPASGMCLDHIWTSHPERMMCVQTKNIGMSDHLPTMAIQHYKGKALLSEDSSNSFSYRDFKRLDVQKFVDELKRCPVGRSFRR